MVTNNFVKYYFKTSSLLGCNVKNVFDQAIQAVLQNRKGENKVEVEKANEENQKANSNKEKKKCFIF